MSVRDVCARDGERGMNGPRLEEVAERVVVFATLLAEAGGGTVWSIVDRSGRRCVGSERTYGLALAAVSGHMHRCEGCS